LIDSPGIVFTSGANPNDIILRNAVKLEQITDPVEPVEVILKRCKIEQLMQIYSIPAFANVNQFLMHIAHKKGKLVKVRIFKKISFYGNAMMFNVNNCYS
jgi:nuclear GTP-binding protein